MYDIIRKNPSKYYAAYTVPGDNIYIGGQISYATAVERVMSMRNGTPYWDSFTANRTNAAKVARAASNGKDPAPWPDGEIGSSDEGEQYWHYHTNGRKTKGHSFFILFK
ncbi:hypothetical protein [Desulfosporosinus shakirovi]|uniref:hypothetical protein n=1 Tax=Desulfosporosinus shakirovi TaxID=2885154 RepID=UPI001E57DE9D|nr:hypothetical protein [Desulfosporosinus sp. SRJS8]MCB8818908.1 hypothetical protein [Desulfosporosinus sp. SRJS8]